jgi:hypothetical protein
VAVACFTKIIHKIDEIPWQYLLNSVNLTAYLGSYESLTQFPTILVLVGHVRFLYRKKNNGDLNITLALPPDYVCYEEQLCDYLSPTFYNGSIPCRYARQMRI